MFLLVYLQQHVGKPTTTCCCLFTSNNMLVNQQQHVVVGLPPTTHVGKPTTTCCVGGLPTYTTQNTSNTTYHWCVVYVVTFRPSYLTTLLQHGIGQNLISKLETFYGNQNIQNTPSLQSPKKFVLEIKYILTRKRRCSVLNAHHGHCPDSAQR